MVEYKLNHSALSVLNVLFFKIFLNGRPGLSQNVSYIDKFNHINAFQLNTKKQYYIIRNKLRNIHKAFMENSNCV